MEEGTDERTKSLETEAIAPTPMFNNAKAITIEVK
ncbi:protein of unknown function [Xenorhabdus doucetiae]|uniref:Uncharacterized protein n=1 Tax=Xenorhabdus doucetiae TaxID=351671 RepID=A0A068QVN7_9GAMM|nr:protein of unknown function [Xenorhabdus doucetiae]